MRAGGLSFPGRDLNRRTGIFAAAALMIVAFSLAAWSSGSVFDRLPRTEDEVTFLFQAKSIASGELIASAPDHPTFFFMSFVIARDGQWFGKYPPGYPAVLSLGELVGQPWIVNAAAAAVAVGLLIAVGCRFYDLRTGLLGAALMALSPFFILQSGSLLSHLVALCWVLALLLLVDVMRTRNVPLAALAAGAAGGMLLVTRPLTAAGIALPFLILAMADLARQRPFWGRYLLVLLGALPFVLLLLVYNDATTGHPLRSAYELWWEYDRVGFGPEYGLDGHTLHDALDNTRSNLRDLSVVLFGWPRRLSLLPVLLAAAVAAVQIRRRGFSRWTSADLLLVGMVVGLIGAHMFYWTPGKMYGPRYYFEIIGALSLLAARGIIWLWDALSREMPVVGERRKFAIPVIIIVLVAYNLFITLPAEAGRYRGWNGVNRADLEMIRQADLDNAVVFAPRPNWQAYAPLFLDNSVDLDGDVIYAVDRGDDRNRTLMEDFPNRRYYRYQDGALTRIDGPGEGRGGAIRPATSLEP